MLKQISTMMLEIPSQSKSFVKTWVFHPVVILMVWAVKTVANPVCQVARLVREVQPIFISKLLKVVVPVMVATFKASELI